MDSVSLNILPPSPHLHTLLSEDHCQTLTAQVSGVLGFKITFAEVPLSEGVRVGADMNNSGSSRPQDKPMAKDSVFNNNRMVSTIF